MCHWYLFTRLFDVQCSNFGVLVLQVVKIEAPELPPIDLKKGRFPFCLVWVPLPVVAWLVPFVGHVGICREDGVIIDFAGRINIDNLAFGSAAKYVPLRLDQVKFPLLEV